MRIASERLWRAESSWGQVLELVQPHRGRVGALAGVSFIGAMLEAALLVTLTSSVLAITEGRTLIAVLGTEITMGLLLWLLGGILIVRLLLALLGVRLSAGLAARVLSKTRSEAAAAYLGASWNVQHGEPAGRLQELLTTFTNQVTHSVKAFTNWVTAWLSLTAFLVAALVVDAFATLFVVIGLVLLGAVLYPIRAAIRRRGMVNAKSGLAFTNAVSELGALGLEMQVFGVRNKFFEQLDSLSERNVQARYRVQTYSEALSPTYMALAYGGVVIAVAVLAAQGVSGLGSTGSVLLLMLRSLSYGQAIQGHSAGIASGSAYVRRLGEAIGAYHREPSDGGNQRPSSVVPLSFESVGFAYGAERETLADVTLTIAAHEVIGVIGPSGAGKSTLIQLMLGLRPPTNGRVTAGAIDLREVDRDWWSQRVAVVAQDALLFTGTVSENIRFFRDGIDDEAVRDAAARANLLADIRALPAGFETHLGERGGQLSGGQRQRLSIARALASNPELLILDEPTSALDVRSESLVRDSLVGLRGKATVVIIAHRMSILDICDRILVIEDGHMSGFDQPSRLVETNNYYRNALFASGLSTADTSMDAPSVSDDSA